MLSFYSFGKMKKKNMETVLWRKKIPKGRREYSLGYKATTKIFSKVQNILTNAGA